MCKIVTLCEALRESEGVPEKIEREMLKLQEKSMRNAKMDMRKSLTQGKLHLAFLVDTYLNMTKSLKLIYCIVLFNI